MFGLPPGHALETALREDGRPWADLTQADPLSGLRALPAEGGGRPPAFARIADILVARQDVSQYRRLRQTIDRMVQAGVPALTAILNDSRPLWLAGVFDRVQRALSLLTRLHQGTCGLLRSRQKNRS